MDGIGRIFSYLSGYLGLKNGWDIIWLVIDILAIAYIIYKVIYLLRDSRAFQLLKGLALIAVISFVAEALELVTLSHALKLLLEILPVLVVVTFQPELRRAIEGIGSGWIKEFFVSSHDNNREAETSIMLEEVVRAVRDMSETRMGALIVFERETNLGEIMRSGTTVDSAVSAQFLKVIFTPPLPLHDGAVIIRNNRIHSAACLLPTTTDMSLNKDLGTRHRAGIGVTENSDCISVIVSEETGIVSVAQNGNLIRNMNSDSLRKFLKDNMIKKSQNKNWRRIKDLSNHFKKEKEDKNSDEK